MKMISVVMLLLVSAPISARPFNDAAADESRLIALENAWNQAQLHHDAGVLDELLPDTFVYTDYDGTVMNKAQFLDDLRDPSYRASLIENTGVRVFLYPNMAIVIGTYHSKGTYKGKPFDHHGRFTDTWIYHKSTWVCVASHTNLIQK